MLRVDLYNPEVGASIASGCLGKRSPLVEGSRRLRIAHLLPRSAMNATRGSEIRIGQLHAGLARHFDLVSIEPDASMTRFTERFPFLGDRKPLSVIAHIPKYASLRRTLHSSSAVLVEFPWLTSLCHGLKKPIIYSAHNVEADKFRSYAAASHKTYSKFTQGLVARMERFAVETASVVLTVSEDDARRLRGLYPKATAHFYIAQNGSVTESWSKPTQAERLAARENLGLPSGVIVVYLAGTDAPPNVDGLRTLVHTAKLLPHIRFAVCGRPFLKKVPSNMHQLGVLSDLEDLLRAADVAVCPIRFGGGTKVKLFDTVGFGLLTICFSESLRGTTLEPGQHVLLSPSTPEGLAKTLSDNVSDECLRMDIAQQGQDFVREHHSWPKITDGVARYISDWADASMNLRAI